MYRPKVFPLPPQVLNEHSFTWQLTVDNIILYLHKPMKTSIIKRPAKKDPFQYWNRIEKKYNLIVCQLKSNRAPVQNLEDAIRYTIDILACILNFCLEPSGEIAPRKD